MHRELHAIFHGIVQGVCFRRTICDHARDLHLVGTVKNLDNGSVEVVVQGSEKQINIFLERVNSSPGHATINYIDHQIRDSQVDYKNFNIIY